jgi:HlyD family secretion protein
MADVERQEERRGFFARLGERIRRAGVHAALLTSRLMPKAAGTSNPTLDAAGNLDLILRPVRRLAFATILICFGGFSAWAALFPLASAAIATGTISPDSSRKQIQHLEGGIIRSVAVKEGEEVQAGQLLMRLETVQAQANYSSRREQWLRLIALRARLEAQEADRDHVVLPEAVRAETGNADLMGFVDNQLRSFQLRRNAILEREAIFQQQIRQLQEEMRSRHIENEGLQEQIVLITRELLEKQDLVRQRLIRSPEYYAVQRQSSATRAKIGSNSAEIARAEQKVEEVKLQVSATRTQFRDQNAQELTKVNADIAQIDEAMVATGDILRRTDVVAPNAGVVLNLRFKTVGGVIKPGDVLMDIVPIDDELIVEARLSPLDIESIVVGMPAKVQLSAFSTKYLPPVDATVMQVAADALADQQTSTRYFPVRVAIDRAALARLDTPAQIKPGMPAEVFILKRERSFLGYLAEPIARSFRRAFREQ